MGSKINARLYKNLEALERYVWDSETFKEYERHLNEGKLSPGSAFIIYRVDAELNDSKHDEVLLEGTLTPDAADDWSSLKPVPYSERKKPKLSKKSKNYEFIRQLIKAGGRYMIKGPLLISRSPINEIIQPLPTFALPSHPIMLTILLLFSGKHRQIPWGIIDKPHDERSTEEQEEVDEFVNSIMESPEYSMMREDGN